MHTDGRMDGQAHMTQLIAAFRNFAKAPKKTAEFLNRFEIFIRN
jgi:hypothetical protein